MTLSPLELAIISFLAIAVAVLAATGSKNEAVGLARTMRPDHLTDPEYRLVYAFTMTDGSSEFFVDPTKAAAGE